MLRNYIKTAWRNLTKNKFYSMITIAGLTFGLAVGLLILIWVQDELSFDTFHKKADNIYRLENLVGTGTSQQIWQNTVAPIGNMAKKELPEVKEAVRISGNYKYALFTYKDKVIAEDHTAFTDPSFFSVFDFALIKGNQVIPFPDDNSVVLTETTAKKYFGNEEPIGKVLVTEDKTNFTVTGIIKDFPLNSSLRYNMLLPMKLLAKVMYEGKDQGMNMTNDFHQFNYDTYLLLQPGVSLQSLATKLRNIHLRNKPDDTDLTYLLQSLKSMHLYKADGTDGQIETVKMFGIIALLILVIACINYVNLSTARSMLRAKEISLRKIVGAAKVQLFIQFIVETAVLFMVSSLLAIVMVYALMPLFNSLSGKQLVLTLSDYHIWMVVMITIAGTLVASSIYPALLLSSFDPLKAMKGKMTARISDTVFRKVLVVTQFAFSIILIIGTLIIGSQLKYIRSRELGYDKEHIFAFYGRGMNPHYDAIKTHLLQQKGITEVTRASANIIRIGGQTGDNEWDGKGANTTFMLHTMAIDKDFIPFFKMKLQAGNNFTGEVADSFHFILNETAVKEAGIRDPIGKKFRLWKTTGIITGVIKDFHYASMKEKIAPAIFYYQPKQNNALYIKTNGKDAANAIAAVETEWKHYNADFPFSYTFLDDSFKYLYTSEERTGALFNVFAVIAILISCLGLFGLAAYTAQIRTKEIGIRKVLGATVPNVILLLSKNFLQPVLIAALIAFPVAWWAMNKWLEGFAYRTSINWWLFALAGLLAAAIALITVSSQAIKAAVANPVKSLRTE